MITKSQLLSPPAPISAVRRQRRRAPLPLSRADTPSGISATLVAWLVAHGRSPMDLPPLSHQALFAAVRSADAHTVHGLLAGADASVSTAALAAAQTDAGESALYVAAEANVPVVVRLLLPLYDLDANTLRSRLDLNAFHVAAKEGHTEVVKEFLGRWPELCSVCDSSNTCPLYSVAVKDHLDVVNAILDTDDNCIKIVRKNGKTSLHTAARIGYHRIVKALIERDLGIVAIRDRKGQTALHMVVKGKT